MNNNNSDKYNVFLLYDREKAIDLAISIKFQLLQKIPSLNFYLDADDTSFNKDIKEIIQKVKYFLIIITEGFFNLDYVQSEIAIALEHNKKIVLIHDEKSCSLPHVHELRQDTQKVFSNRVLPYYRREPFRSVSIQEIFKFFSSDSISNLHFGCLNPRDLAGINGYGDEIPNTGFCWRWYDRSSSERFRVVTIEDGGNSDQGSAVQFRPRDLKGINGYADGLEMAYFCWRWFSRDGTRYRFVTLEDGGAPHEGFASIIPGYFAGVNGYANGIEALNFCWRNIDRDGTNYRVLTLE